MYGMYVTLPFLHFFFFYISFLNNLKSKKIFELRSTVSKELEPSLKTKIPDPKRRRWWMETAKALPK